MIRTTISIQEGLKLSTPSTKALPVPLLGKRRITSTAAYQTISTYEEKRTTRTTTPSFSVISTMGCSQISHNDSEQIYESFEPAISKKSMTAGVFQKVASHSDNINQQQQQQRHPQALSMECFAEYMEMFSRQSDVSAFSAHSSSAEGNLLSAGDTESNQAAVRVLTPKPESMKQSALLNERVAASTSASMAMHNRKILLSRNKQRRVPLSQQHSQSMSSSSMTTSTKFDESIPFENYISQFIYHKKYKDFESEEQKYQGVSRFHNLNRMFMHNIIKILSRENLECFDIPATIVEKLSSMVLEIKNTAFKKYNNGKSKTCFFNHHHYNLLFLRITSATMKLFERSPSDLEVHRTLMGVTLAASTPRETFDQEVEFCNLLKFYAFAVVEATISQNIRVGNYTDCVRLQYVQRVLDGISKLRQGITIKRF